MTDLSPPQNWVPTVRSTQLWELCR